MNPKSSIDARERVRKSLDKIKVNNPFDEDAFIIWDGFSHRVPAHGSAVVERYLADKYLEEQVKKIITHDADEAIKAENEKRVAKGFYPMDMTREKGEQLKFEAPYYANWTARFSEVIQKYGLYGGLVQEYGMDYIPQTVQAPVMPQDTPLTEQLDNSPLPPPPPPIRPVETPVADIPLTDQLEGKTQFQLRSMARERGIKTEKTATKDELIKLISQ